jgi:hypothetical protein
VRLSEGQAMNTKLLGEGKEQEDTYVNYVREIGFLCRLVEPTVPGEGGATK